MLIGLAAWCAPASAVQQRIALVVGNAAYVDKPLRNPVNDAADLAAALKRIGFEVMERKNRTADQLRGDLSDFQDRLSPGAVGLFYFAGHGVQAGRGQNYLLPVGVTYKRERDAEAYGLEVGSVLRRMEDSGEALSLVILDACRDSPLPPEGRSTASRGLSRMEAPSGSMIAFATAPGSIADDNSTGRNGLYTQHLLAAIETPGMRLEDVFKRVRRGVEKDSNSRQSPEEIMKLTSDEPFYFKSGSGVQLASARAEPTGRPAQNDPEEDAWAATKAANTVAAFDAYLNEYPKGSYASAARIGKVAVQQRSASSNTYASGQVFKDCTDCPEMVVIPAGSFTMGSNASEQALVSAGDVATTTDLESPQHSDNIKSFAAGKYAVTKGEFARFISATSYQTEAEQGNGCYGVTGTEWKKDKAYNWRNVGFAQGYDHPVVCVSWNDAQAYAKWVSQSSGKQYRLLSESEREYAARGGSQTAFWWGESINTSQANYDGTGTPYNGSPTGEYRHATVPVSRFSANPFGLYNVHGNILEWTEDCFHDTYSGSPTDGSAWTTGCSGNYRMLRGGSWLSFPADLRSAFRFGNAPDIRDYSGGFRVARTLTP